MTPSLFQPGRCLVIAEVGSNHGGDAGLAMAAIAAAKEAGADVVKFQMYQAEQLVDDKMPVLKYIAQTHKTQRERFKSLQLKEDVFLRLAEEAKRLELHFMVTPFYEGAVDFLNPLVPAFKVASGDLTNLALLKAVAATGKPVILSTGLSTEAEIAWAVAQVPADQLHLLHCVGAYPTPDEQVNLFSIHHLAERFGIPVGFSDHSRGVTACVAAVAMGATIIEKHFLPDAERKVADRDLSVGVAEFRRMVEDIRRIETMRGRKGKTVQPDEAYFQTTLRRSLYARDTLRAGETLTADRLIALRPWSPDALSPMEIETVSGRVMKREVAAGTILRNEDLG